MIVGRNLFDKPAKNNTGTYKNIRKTAANQEDDQTTGCSLNYIYLNETQKLIAIDLSKQLMLINTIN